MSTLKYIYFISAGHMTTDVASGALPAILPFLVTERGMSYTEVAGLMFASSMLSSLLQPVFGYLADRTARHWFMGAGIMLSCFSFSMTGFLENYWVMFALVALMGAGNSMFHPEAARLVTMIAGQRHRGQGMATFSVGGNVGFAVGPLLAVALVSVFGLNGLSAFGGIGTLMGIATFLFVPRIARDAISMEKKEQRSADDAEPTETCSANDWPAFLRLTLVLLGRSIVFNGIMAFLPLYCIEAMGVSNAIGSTTLSVFAVCGIAMTMVGGWLADHMGLIRAARYTTVVLVPVLVLIAHAPNMLLVYALLIPLCFATHGVYSPMVILGQTYLAKNIGLASGVTLGLSTSFGGMVSPLIGRLADHEGIASVMYLLMVIGIICTVGAFLLPKPK